MLLVDLDNIMFHKGEARVDILKLRLKAIHAEAEEHELHWFCNMDTDAALKKGRIVLRGSKHVKPSEVDCADHALVHHASKHAQSGHAHAVHAVHAHAGRAHAGHGQARPNIVIVTADMSLIRLAMYITTQRHVIRPKPRLGIASFGEGVILNVRAASPAFLAFVSTSDLHRFLTTLSLYDTRYPQTDSTSVTPNACSARMIPSSTSSRLRLPTSDT